MAQVMGWDDQGNEVEAANKRLTRSGYYAESKIDACNKRSQKWNKTNQALIQSLADNNFKTMNPTVFQGSVVNYNNNFPELWQKFAVSKKWKRQAFFLFGSKKKVVHRFFSSFTKIEGFDSFIMYYGDGRFPSGKRGERYVPCKYVKEICEVYFDCKDTNEFRTSQVCPDCFERLWDVYNQRGNGRKKYNRNLKYCNSYECRNKRIKNRDKVGCRGIYLKAMGNYPLIYDRNGGIVWATEPERYILRSKK